MFDQRYLSGRPHKATHLNARNALFTSVVIAVKGIVLQ